ncbi:MAG: amidohydrolase family protein [Thermoanaerobaculia bacterium]
MRLRVAVLLIIAGLAFAAAKRVQAQAPAPRKLALVGGMLLDGYEVPPLHHAAILIEGNRIVAVGPASQMTIPPDAEVVDTSGRTMLPGLIDLHAHLQILGHGDYERWDPWIGRNKLLEKVSEISAKQLLMAGVTSAVDLGGTLKESLAIRGRINSGAIPGPRMWMAGPWITRNVGDYYTGLPNQYLVNTPAEAAKAVDDLANAGVDVIKAYVELKPEHYKAIADAAHKRKLRVHAHVYDPTDVKNAFEAGIDVLQHVGSAGMPRYDATLVNAIAAKGTPVVVTAAHRAFLFPATVAFPERLQDPRLKEDFGPQIWSEVQSSFKNFQALSYFSTTDQEMRWAKASLSQWIEANVTLGMGTDSGTPMNFHTEALWREIKAHVDTGMSPQRAIGAATRVNAVILGRGKDLGTLEPGKLADIIVVRGDPLFDVTALANVEVVVKDGVVWRGAKPRP